MNVRASYDYLTDFILSEMFDAVQFWRNVYCKGVLVELVLVVVYHKIGTLWKFWFVSPHRK